MSAPLPPGWTALQDPHGRWYFHNSATNTTQWHPPAPAGQPQHGYAPPPPPQAPAYAAQHAPQGYPQHGGHPPHGAPQAYPPGAVAPGAPPSGSKPVASGSGGRYTYNAAVEYKLKEKAFSLSGDSFQVKDTATGQTAFKIKGNVMSFKDSKKLLDPSGQPIYTMNESIISLRGRMSIMDSSTKEPVVTLRKKGFIPMMGTSTVQVWRGASDDGSPWVEVKGDFFRKDFNFTEKSSGRVVATVKRKGFNMSNILLEKDTYVIRIEPGIDAALMVFLVVALDEQYRDDGNRTGIESRLGGFF